MLRGFRQLSTSKKGAALKLPISPLAGEMSGRTEGGVKERGVTVPFLIVFIQGISATELRSCYAPDDDVEG
ncbi:hypothetical protein ABID26_004925 [Mesorhizobium shonense]|uniref:Transposase n=1 Tax=Mesorhizobium shonense TaxID=1209948 RepID=A0ABV2HY53_9HYPH